MWDDRNDPQDLAPPEVPLTRSDYVSPRIVRLGTLAELTQGGTVGPDDGLGGSGDGGSV